jgi:uncharacterized protein YjiS (DUF1127 family)
MLEGIMAQTCDYLVQPVRLSRQLLRQAAFPVVLLRGLARWLATAWRVRRDTEHLLGMSDERLRDIGLTRDRVAVTVRTGRLDGRG